MKISALIKGAAVLTFAGIISKLFGAVYRIPFFRLIGSEGMGLYQMAYPIYTMLLAVSSAGVPVAVSKLISESLAQRDIYQVQKIFRVSLVFFAIVSGITSILLYKSAYFLADRLLHDTRAYYSIAAISPAVFLVGLMSVFRGYFQGFQEMFPTACSQVIEQLVRVLTVLIGAYVFLSMGIEYASAAATFGAVTGAAAGTIVLVILYLVRRVKTPFPSRSRAFIQKKAGSAKILYSIIILALPISIAGLVMPVMQTLDALTVPQRLQLAGYTVSKATQLYGELTGGAFTLINIPTVLTISLATSLVPAISRALERNNINNINRMIERAVEITVLICLPASVGLSVLATPISRFLFDCPEVGYPLAVLAPSAIFLGLHQTTTGILQGLGKTYIPVINLLVGAIIKFTANYTLTSIPDVGIIGAALGTIAGFTVSSSLNILFIHRFTKWKPCYQMLLLKPAIVATIMAVGVYFTYWQTNIIMDNSWATVTAIIFGAFIYFLLLAATGTFKGFWHL